MRETQSEGIWDSEPGRFTTVVKFLIMIVIYTPRVCFKWQTSTSDRASWANAVMGLILLVAVSGWGFTLYSLAHLEFIAAVICFTTSCVASLIVHGLMGIGVGEDVGYFRDL